MTTLDLIHPFAPSRFSGDRTRAAERLWEWYDGVGRTDDRVATEIVSLSEEERAGLIKSYAVPERLSDTVFRAIVEDCATYRLPCEFIVRQAKTATLFSNRRTFADWQEMDKVLRGWPIPHGRLVAALAGMGRSWQLGALDDLARAHFLTNRLSDLHMLQSDGILWVPIADFGKPQTGRHDIEQGIVTEGVRRVLWKQLVRIRDRMARTTLLYRDFPRRYQKAYRKWWMRLSWVLDEIEKREYDLWKTTLEPGVIDRAAHFIQSWFARRAFRGQ